MAQYVGQDILWLLYIILSFFNALSRPVFGDRLCPHCKLSITPSYLEHLVETHQELQLGSVEEIDILASVSPAIIQTGKRLLPLSSPPS